MAANDTTQSAPNPMAGYPISAKDFNSKQAKHTNKLIDYYEGRQKHHLVHIMDGKGEFAAGKRTDWKERGIIPRVRNITKSIVDKSGLLFNRPPKLTIAIQNELNPVTDETFNAIMESADWIEVFQNVDVYTRLTKSTILLQQKYIPDGTTTINGQYAFDQTNGDALLFTLLHQGNSVVKMNPQRTQITALAFITTAPDKDGNFTYRLITPEEIIDVDVTSDNDAYGSTMTTEMKETIVGREVNPDGIVPASFFYDINKPRDGYWASVPEDLKDLQEMLNLHLTDMEYAMAWQKGKSAVITADIKNSDDNRGSQIIPAAQPGHTDGGETWENVPFYQQKTITNLGGLGSIIKLGLDGGGQPGKLDFVGPDTDLAALQSVMDTMCEAVASDWDVNLKYGGGGSATSGFQLVVEESNNLTLREKRAQSMVAGFRRFYQITQQLYTGQITEGLMQVEFAPPNLPVNQEEQERIWSDRIDNNRASPVDYFMEVKGMTEDQANAKSKKVINENNQITKTVVLPTPPPPPAPTEGALADKTLQPVRQDQNNG
jgi:hypothetical protein